MKNLNRQKKTVYFPQSIAAKGKRAYELKPFELGLIDMETGLTVDRADWCADKQYQFAQGSSSKGLNNAMQPDQRGAKLPIRSLEISRVDKAHAFQDANPEGLPFVGYLGWDGISTCKSLQFECGASYGILIKMRGQAIRNTFGGNNIEEIIPFTSGCCDDCAADEACEKTLETMLKAIQNDSFYVNKYFMVNQVKSCCPIESPFDRKNYQKFELTVCDTGDSLSLSNIQRQYPDYDIEVKHRVDALTTYEVCISAPYSAADQTAVDDAKTALDTAIAANVAADITAAKTTYDTAVATAQANSATAAMPVDYTQRNSKVLVCDNCPDCPTTFTKVDSGDKYIVCFNEAAVTAVQPLANFTSDDPAVKDPAIEALGATVPGYTADSAKELGYDCGQVTLQVCVTKDTDLSAFTGGTVTRLGECTGYCEGTATYAWCPTTNAYKISRCMEITKKNDECDAPELEDVVAAIGNRDDVVAGSVVIKATNDCMTTYELVQCNNDCLEDGCDTFGKDGAKFDQLPSFVGHVWKACSCEGWTFDPVTGCPVEPAADPDGNCLCGLKFEVAKNTREILECTHSLWDQIEREPITMEISIIDQSSLNKQDFSDCELLDVDWTIAQHPTIPQGDGRYVAREEETSRNYEGYLYQDPKHYLGNLMSARLGYDYAADPNKFYNSIQIYHNYDRNRQSWHKSDSSQREMIKFYVEMNNVAFFEELKGFLNGTLLQGGVCNLLK